MVTSTSDAIVNAVVIAAPIGLVGLLILSVRAVKASRLKAVTIAKLMRSRDDHAAQLQRTLKELEATQQGLEKSDRELAAYRDRLDLPALQYALDDSGSRNVELKQKILELQQALQKSEYELHYIRQFATRFGHDSISRLEVLRSNIGRAGAGLDEETIDLSSQHLDFIEESLRLHLAPDIGAYVRACVSARTDSFNLSKRLVHLVDILREKDPQSRLTIKADSGDIWLFGNWLHVELLLSNLVSNAFKHGATDGPIEIDLRLAGDTAVIEVENETDPIDVSLMSGSFPSGSTANQRFGVFFIRQVVNGYGGHCEWRNTIRTTGAGKLQRQSSAVRAILSLPIMPPWRPRSDGAEGEEPEVAAEHRLWVEGSVPQRTSESVS